MAFILAEPKSRKSRIFNRLFNLTNMLYHCRILNCLEIRVPTLPGVKAVGLNLGISLVVSDIWVGWSDSVVYRNTSQPEQLPLCPSRLCRKRILTQFWHDCWLKLNLLWKPGLVFLVLLLSLSNAFIFFVLFFFKKNRDFCSRHAASDPSWWSGCIHKHMVHFKPWNS